MREREKEGRIEDGGKERGREGGGREGGREGEAHGRREPHPSTPHHPLSLSQWCAEVYYTSTHYVCMCLCVCVCVCVFIAVSSERSKETGKNSPGKLVTGFLLHVTA